MSPTRMECSFHLASPAAQSCNELWVHMVHGDSHLPCLSAAVMSGSPVFLACMNPAWKSLCPLHSAQSLFLQSEVVPGLSTGDVSHWLPLSGGKHMACFFSLGCSYLHRKRCRLLTLFQATVAMTSPALCVLGVTQIQLTAERAYLLVGV